VRSTERVLLVGAGPLVFGGVVFSKVYRYVCGGRSPFWWYVFMCNRRISFKLEIKIGLVWQLVFFRVCGLDSVRLRGTVGVWCSLLCIWVLSQKVLVFFFLYYVE
jgi:hypothetical protein